MKAQDVLHQILYVRPDDMYDLEGEIEKERGTRHQYILGGINTLRKILGEEISKNDELRLLSAHQILQRSHRFIIQFFSQNVAFAESKTSDSWRNTKLHMVFLLRAHGLNELADKVTKIKNPSRPENRNRKPGVKKRKRSITPADVNTLIADRMNSDDIDTASFVRIAYCLGIRPSELQVISWQREPDGRHMRITIGHKKQTAVGKKSRLLSRGIGRELIMEWNQEIADSIDHWARLRTTGVTAVAKRIKNAEERLAAASTRLWPQRKQKVVAYSFRYNFGSRMKYMLSSDPEGPRKLAALMGHKSTRSASLYGDYNAGRGESKFGLQPKVWASDATCNRVVDNRTVQEKLSREKRRLEDKFLHLFLDRLGNAQTRQQLIETAREQNALIRRSSGGLEFK